MDNLYYITNTNGNFFCMFNNKKELVYTSDIKEALAFNNYEWAKQYMTVNLSSFGTHDIICINNES